jgi:hypothetical protein
LPCRKLFDLPREQVSERYEILRLGRGGRRTDVICGAVQFDNPAAHELVKLLPEVIHIASSASQHLEWIQSMLRFMAAEAKTLLPGGETVITRLADILVIQAIRAWIEQDPAAQTGWLGALRDKQIGRAISSDSPKRRASMDGCWPGRGSRNVPLRLRRTIHRTRWRTRHALRDPLAHAYRLSLAARGWRDHRRDSLSPWLSIRGRLQPRLQALHRHLTRLRPEKRT